MPIDRSEWEKGRTAERLESQIEAFLASNRGNAFTESEIVSGLYTLKYESLPDIIVAIAVSIAVSKALETLVKEGRVREKSIKERIGENTYYMIA